MTTFKEVFESLATDIVKRHKVADTNTGDCSIHEECTPQDDEHERTAEGHIILKDPIHFKHV